MNDSAWKLILSVLRPADRRGDQSYFVCDLFEITNKAQFGRQYELALPGSLASEAEGRGGRTSRLAVLGSPRTE